MILATPENPPVERQKAEIPPIFLRQSFATAKPLKSQAKKKRCKSLPFCNIASSGGNADGVAVGSDCFNVLLRTACCWIGFRDTQCDESVPSTWLARRLHYEVHFPRPICVARPLSIRSSARQYLVQPVSHAPIKGGRRVAEVVKRFHYIIPPARGIGHLQEVRIDHLTGAVGSEKTVLQDELLRRSHHLSQFVQPVPMSGALIFEDTFQHRQRGME